MDNLPKHSRKMIRRDLDSCILHWTEVLDKGVGDTSHGLSLTKNDLNISVDWKLEAVKQ